jgi:hypothetical protein
VTGPGLNGASRICAACYRAETGIDLDDMRARLAPFGRRLGS